MARKKSGKKRQKRSIPLHFIAATALLIVAVIVLLIFVAVMLDAKPVATKYQTALNQFISQGVSPLIAPDIAADFVSGNYTLRQLYKKYPGFSGDIKLADRTLRNADKEVLALVDDEKITRADLNAQSALLPQEYREALTDEQILEEMINERLLLNDAVRRGIVVSEQEADEAYQNLLIEGGITEQQLIENIGSYGLGMDDLRKLLVRQLTLAKLLNETMTTNETVNLGELKRYYDTHRDEFVTPGMVTVRHILIALSNTTDEVAAQRIAAEVLAKYTSGSNFCALVVNYSNDMGSKTTCGEYAFSKGYMVKPFEDAAFAMKSGETRIVNTQFGSHVILKINETPGNTVPFEKVAPLIEQKLASEQRSEMYNAYIVDLRSRADVVNYLTLPSPTQPIVESEEIVPIELNETIETEVAAPAKLEGASQTSTTVTISPSKTTDLTEFAACLKQKGAVLYIASWDSASRKELETFGAAEDHLAVIDCAANAKECAAVKAYPTWKVGGIYLLGTMTKAELSAKTGCALP